MASNNPLVSVVVPFFNAGNFIEEAVASVFAQTYNHWELLLVDDGSTDCSTAIACDLVRRFPHRVRYLEHQNHQNRGISASRNLGLHHAQGELITFLDADDLMLPSKLEAQAAILASQPDIGMICGARINWYYAAPFSADAISTRAPRSTGHAPFSFQGLDVEVQTVFRPPSLLICLLQRKDIPYSILLRREVGVKVGGFDEEFTDMYEDHAFLAKCFLNVSAVVAHRCTGVYRVHRGSFTENRIESGTYHPTEPHRAREKFLKWVRRYLEREGVTDPEVWRVLGREFLPYSHPGLYQRLRQVRALGRWLKEHAGRRFPWMLALSRQMYHGRRRQESAARAAATAAARAAAVAAGLEELAALYEANGRTVEVELVRASACRTCPDARVAVPRSAS